MPNPEVESLPPQLDNKELERSIHQLGLLYGIRGLRAQIVPGAETSCARLKNGLLITLDPQQVIEGYRDENSGEPTASGVSPEVTALFMTAHELGHAKDFLDPEWRMPPKVDRARDFFDCFIDDTVIDSRSRRVPLFDASADAVYSHQMPRDVTKFPKHVQLMTGLRINKVVRQPEITIDPKVDSIISGLTHFEKNGRHYNILDVMADPRTTLKERRRIADQYILPHYLSLLEQDKQEGNVPKEGSENSENGGDINFDELYEKLEQAVHGHSHESGEGQGQPDEQGTPSQSNPDSSSLAGQIAAIVSQNSGKQAGDKGKQLESAAIAEAIERANREHHEAQLGRLAGSVAAEMNLEPDDAESYVRSLDKWTSTVKDVATVFMKLAAPSKVFTSPRYKRSAHTEGVRLHPTTLAGVALQLATDQEQAIWQPIERRAERKAMSFGGLDINLIVDVSGSMGGEKGQSAADTALCLIEGLQLARYRVGRESGRNRQPDVRTQIIAFGSSTEVLSELSYVPTAEQRGKTYVNLRNASSGSTLVEGSLDIVGQNARANPNRQAIVLIISDGQFYDQQEALSQVKRFPKSVYVTQLVIGEGTRDFITDKHEEISNPAVLPEKLLGVLRSYIKQTNL